jgi:Tfp pilus assembly protein PilZ
LIDKRIHARHPIALEVELLDGTRSYTGATRDLSLGGMFICTQARLPFGSDISVRIRLPALEDAAVLEATVRWNTAEGVGVGFRSLRARQVWALNHLLKSCGFLI